MFPTKGDVNPSVDAWHLDAAEPPAQARVAFHLPYVGFALAALAESALRMLVIGIPALLVALSVLAGCGASRPRKGADWRDPARRPARRGPRRRRGVARSRRRSPRHDQHGQPVATAADWVAPSVTLTAPADGRRPDDTTLTVCGAAGNATGDDPTVTLNVYSGSTRERDAGADAARSLAAARRGRPRAPASARAPTRRRRRRRTARATPGRAPPTPSRSTPSPRPRLDERRRTSTGTVGHIDAGDTITFTYSEPMLASSILSGWSGEQRRDGEGPVLQRRSADSFTVLDCGSAANVKLEAGTTATAV